jgi:hypothetical protein
VLDVDGSGHHVDQPSEESRSTHLIELALALQLVADGEKVDGLVPLVQRQRGFEDPAVLLAVEVPRLQASAHPDDGVRVDQEPAEDRFLGFDVLRWQSLDSRFLAHCVAPPSR